MNRITYKGKAIHTLGEVPKVGEKAPEFVLTKSDFTEIHSDMFLGKRIILNVFVSIDTPVCANSVRRFDKEASKFRDIVILGISKDIPFALKRFCGSEGIKDLIPVSAFRSDFGEKYNISITDGPFRTLLSRVVFIIGKKGIIDYVELISELTHEPDYEQALEFLHSYS